MTTYEINYLVLQSKTEDLDQIKERVEKIIKATGAKITETLEYKKRKLAYEIKHENYGFFTVFRFELKKGDKIFEIKQELNLDGDIARYIIVNTEELPELRQTMADKKEKETVKKEDLDKILSDKEAPKKKKLVSTKKEVAIKKEVDEKESIKESVEGKIDNSEKTKKESSSRKEKELKTDLEELDKKLDEILDI